MYILHLDYINTCTCRHRKILTYSQAFRLETHQGANHSRRLVGCLADYQSSKYQREHAHSATSILLHTHTHVETHIHTPVSLLVCQCADYYNYKFFLSSVFFFFSILLLMSVLAEEGITAGLSRHKRSDRDLKIPKLLSYAGNSEVEWGWGGVNT